MRRLAVVLLLLVVCVPGARAWTWPVEGSVLRGFEFDPAHPFAGGQHRGVDVAAAAGARVLAPAGGTVSFAGTVPGNGKTVTSVSKPRGATAGGSTGDAAVPAARSTLFTPAEDKIGLTPTSLTMCAHASPTT